MTQYSQRRQFPVQLPQDFGGSIRASIVNNDNFEITDRRQCPAHFDEQGFDILCFIMHWDDN
jgi:hypothetical protein